MSSTATSPVTGPPTAPVESAVSARKSTTRRQLRGSSLLLLGQVFSKASNFITQLLIVRYLSQADYGAFAYALSIVALVHGFVTFGLDRAVTRFISIYHEQEDYKRLAGTLLMVVGTVLSLGLASVLLFYSLHGMLVQRQPDNELALALLMVLILLAPVQALDDLLVGLFAVFGNSRAIFFRKHVIAPGLKLAVIVVIILSRSSLFFLAVGYLLAGVLGVTYYSVMLVQLLRKQGVLQHFSRARMVLPWREIFTFTIPLLTSDLVYVVMNSMDAVLLEHYWTSVDVAALRAVQPTAKLNQVVLASFGLLFTPAAARLFAHKDRERINQLYWQNAIWTAVASFPIFVLTFSVARSLTVLLYGERYEDSAIILALLSFAYYFNAALGQNGLTLKVYGQVRYVVVINLLALIANLGINLLLIPRYGAFGAALGTTGTLVLHNILKQAGLRLGTGINLFERRYLTVYLTIALSSATLLMLQWWLAMPLYVDLALAVVASLVVFGVSRKLLNLQETFPELLRLPVVGRFLA